MSSVWPEPHFSKWVQGACLQICQAAMAEQHLPAPSTTQEMQLCPVLEVVSGACSAWGIMDVIYGSACGI